MRWITGWMTCVCLDSRRRGRRGMPKATATAATDLNLASAICCNPPTVAGADLDYDVGTRPGADIC